MTTHDALATNHDAFAKNHDAFGSKHCNAGTTHDAFKPKHDAARAKRVDEMTELVAFGTKPVDELPFSGVITPVCSKIGQRFRFFDTNFTN